MQPAELRNAIRSAYREVRGVEPSRRTLDMLSAHAAHETGNGASMYNFNFGGIKGAGPSGRTAQLRTREYAGAEPYETVDRFRAYGSLREGARDYVKLMATRYAPALGAAERGDVDGFCQSLATLRYYTAPPAAYTAAMRGLLNAPPQSAATWQPPARGGADWGPGTTDAPSALELCRLVDALASLGTRIGAPETEEPEAIAPGQIHRLGSRESEVNRL